VTAAISHRLLGVGEITLHVAEAGEGPRVLLTSMVGDVIGLLDTLGEETASVVGHDWADLADAGTRLIERPVLFLGGEVDTATRFVDHQYMEQAVPHLARVILPGCGHWVQQEQPQQVNRELTAFLDAYTTARHP
jgi:pimeloyl-ACP methyl ester carboxylesterase